jgi:hypothetical protein
MRHLFACLFLLALTNASSIAELPPSAYEKMQSAATEVFRVKILRVDETLAHDPGIKDVALLAQVLKVGRSKTKVKPDDLITIKYRITTHPAGWVGPGEVPLLKEDAETVAYLQPIAGTADYAPAAGVMSFDQF